VPGENGIRGSKDLRAEIGKFPNSTNERKKMSNKTIKQRIAVVAVSALTAGVLSVMSAPAANAASEITTGTAGTTDQGVVVARAGAATAQTMTITSAGSLTVAVASAGGGVAARVTISGGTFTGITSGGTINAAGTTITQTADTAIVGAIAKPSATGVMVITSYATATSTTAVDKLTVTVVAAASIGKLSASESFASLEASSSADSSASTYTDEDGANRKANGEYGIIDWSINDENGNNMSSTTVVSASATNGALVSFSSGAAANSTSATTTGTDGAIFVAQPVANAPVSTVVTISVNGAVWTSKSLTITGDVTKITVVNYTDGRTASSGTVTGTLLAYAYDSAGNQVARTISANGSLYDSVVSTSTSTITTSTTTYASGTYTCASAGTAKVQYSITNTALASIKSPEVAVRCAGDPDSWTASLDKATYTPGSIATLTITAKDSKGNLTNGVATLGTTGTYAVTISGGQLTAVTAPTTVDTFSDAPGAKVYKFTVGTTEGDYQLIVDLPKWTTAGAGSATAATVGYKVASGTATVSNADVLKSIVSLIASINKQIQALQKLILQRR